MHYNPLAYVHSEKDILKLVNVLISNTKGEGNAGDPFWNKSETLLYTALISYICSYGPEDERNFNTLVSMLNRMDTREDDEDYQNQVDLMFAELEAKEPQHFAVRQYKKFKLQVVVDYKTDIYSVYACYLDGGKRHKRKIHESYYYCYALEHVSNIVYGRINFYV